MKSNKSGSNARGGFSFSKFIMFLIAFAVTGTAFYLIKISPYGIHKIETYNDGYGMLDMVFHYTPDFALQMIRDLGDAGRNAYSRTLFFDLFFALGFVVVHSTIIIRIVHLLHLDKKYDKIAIVCILRAAFDLTEDVFLSIALRNYATVSISVLKAASVLTTLKWIMMASSFILPFVIFIIVNLNKVIRKDTM